MIPIRDSIKSSTFPVVNTAFITINTLVFLFELSLGNELERFFNIYGLIPEEFYRAIDRVDLAKMFFPTISSMFMHGGWMHFIGNMWFLYIFGDNVEDSMGHGRYLAFYTLCGVGAALAQIFSDVYSNVPMIGASGAIAGIMGAYMVLHPRGRILTLVPIFFFFQFINVPALVFLLIWIGIQTLQGFLSFGTDVSGGVAWWAHIGGFAVGLLLIFLFRRPRQNYDDFDMNRYIDSL